MPDLYSNVNGVFSKEKEKLLWRPLKMIEVRHLK